MCSAVIGTQTFTAFLLIHTATERADKILIFVPIMLIFLFLKENIRRIFKENVKTFIFAMIEVSKLTSTMN